jgi:hypothetical protein
MSGQYILKDGEPVAEPDPLAWGAWMEIHERRRVDETFIGETRVSTVFLGLDHGWGGRRPVLWETLVFGGPLDQEMLRYHSREAALEGHAATCSRVRLAQEVQDLEPEAPVEAHAQIEQ